MSALRRARRSAIVWLVAVVAIALGAAGLVTGRDAAGPDRPRRPELTRPATRRSAAARRRRGRPRRARRRGRCARDAGPWRPRRPGRRPTRHGRRRRSRRATGWSTDPLGAAATAPIWPRRAGTSATPPPSCASRPRVRARYARPARARRDRGLDRAWAASTTGGAVAATSSSTLLAEHDRPSARRPTRAARRKYTEAMALDPADGRSLKAGARSRDRLANTVDVIDARPVARPQRGVRQGPARAVHALTRARRQGQRRRPRRDRGREGRAARLPPDSRGADRDHVGHRPGRDERRRSSPSRRREARIADALDARRSARPDRRCRIAAPDAGSTVHCRAH